MQYMSLQGEKVKNGAHAVYEVEKVKAHADDYINL